MTLSEGTGALRTLATLIIAVAWGSMLGGCGTLVSPSTLASITTSIFGAYANGAVMGGSVVGVLREQVIEPEATPPSPSGAPREASAESATVAATNTFTVPDHATGKPDDGNASDEFSGTAPAAALHVLPASVADASLLPHF